MYIGEKNEKGQRDGIGTYTYPNAFFKYSGSWLNGLKEGKGVFSMRDGSSYEGDFIQGEMTGLGIKRYQNGDVYTGEFVIGERNGKGIFHRINGEHYEGNWVNNYLSGKGKYTSKNGDIYEGYMKNNMEHGYGEKRYKNGDMYEGEWKKGLWDGKGKFENDEMMYEGEFVKGERNGKGKMIQKEDKNNHEVVYIGEYKNDIPINYPTHVMICSNNNGGGEEVEMKKKIEAVNVKPGGIMKIKCCIVNKINEDENKIIFEKNKNENGRKIKMSLYKLPDDYIKKKKKEDNQIVDSLFKLSELSKKIESFESVIQSINSENDYFAIFNNIEIPKKINSGVYALYFENESKMFYKNCELLPILHVIQIKKT